MKYYIDTEFLEGTQTKRFLWVNIGKTKPTIDLISIGIVAENNKKYYAVSKDFNLKEAWNRYQIKQVSGDARNIYPQGVKEYWIRENVLKPIFDEWLEIDYNKCNFNYNNFKWHLNEKGKTNTQIAKEVKNFINAENFKSGGEFLLGDFYPNIPATSEFYGYYCDYDWVAFCWLFGKMIDLPHGFPMHCTDLKQELDKRVESLSWSYHKDILNEDNVEGDRLATFDEKLNKIKKLEGYPKQINNHNAIYDANWNKKLHEFLNKL